MKTSVKGLVELVAHEGIVIKRYKDSVGVWTVGVGHTKAAGGIDPVNYTRTLTVEQCLDMLMVDISKYEKSVNRLVVGRKIPQHMYDGMVSFHYNTGKISSASFVKYLLSGASKEAYKRILWWKKPAEIIGRRTKEAKLMVYGEYSSDGKKIPVYKTNSRHQPVLSHYADIREWAKDAGSGTLPSSPPVRTGELPAAPASGTGEIAVGSEPVEKKTLFRSLAKLFKAIAKIFSRGN
jgi:lysozyme